MAEITRETMVDGRYRVLSRVGSGGMADVFCAEDMQLGRKVALKMLHRRFAEDAEFVERFHREAQAAAGLSHPNVVAVYDRGQWDGTYYIAMEYLPGRTLKELIRARAPLSPLRAIDLTVQILKAARSGHAHAVIHRDLKPHNVIVDEEDRAKVTDFGIARAGASDMTETGSIMGTAQYLSPEQAQGRPVSPQSDLYSIGVILYELLTGRLPFDAETAVTIALKHVSEAPPPPTQFNPAIPADLERIVLWALEKDPARRPPDAQAFIAALEEVRARLAADAPPLPRATTSFAPAPAAAVAPFDPPTALAPPPVFAPPPLQPPPERGAPRRPARWPWVLLALVVIAAIGIGAYVLLSPKERTVPGVVGKDIDTAQALLSSQGFILDVKRVADSKVAGTVLSQSPKSGADAHKGATVVLTVSSGPAIGTVPDVAGITAKSARARIVHQGFKPRTKLQPDPTILKGIAIGTQPPAQSELSEGKSVTLLVSSGPPPVQVPNLVGQDVASAQSQLTTAKLVSTVTKADSDQTPGTVLAESPKAGTSVPSGSKVVLTVAQASKVTVPDLTGKTQDDADNALGALGLIATTSQQQVTGPDQDGIVLSQDPAPGTKRSKGAHVKLVIGLFSPLTTPTGPTPSPGGPSG